LAEYPLRKPYLTETAPEGAVSSFMAASVYQQAKQGNSLKLSAKRCPGLSQALLLVMSMSIVKSLSHFKNRQSVFKLSFPG
jgi:hypothetical protein